MQLGWRGFLLENGDGAGERAGLEMALCNYVLCFAVKYGKWDMELGQLLWYHIGFGFL